MADFCIPTLQLHSILFHTAPAVINSDHINMWPQQKGRLYVSWEPPDPANGQTEFYYITVNIVNMSRTESFMINSTEKHTKLDIDCNKWGQVNTSVTISAVNIEEYHEMIGSPSPIRSAIMCQSNCKYSFQFAC